uniref:uncharacterized protein n=1 Tax=Centroberyx gerrardi TaxID=166262 RepID=UPI003AAE4050
MAEIAASSQPDLPVRRRRGRPPKRAKNYNFQQQPVEEKVQSPSIGVPTDQEGVNSCLIGVEEVGVRSHPFSEAGRPSEKARRSTSQLPVQELTSLPSINIASVQEAVNTSSRDVQKIKVSCLPVSAESSSRGRSSEKEPPQSQQLPMEMEEEAIQSPTIQVMPAVETVKTPSTESPKAPSVQPRERHASYPTLQDAMLLVEAMNAQASAYHLAMEDTFSSPQRLNTLQTVTVAPGQLPIPISPQTSASPPSPQPPTVPPQASFSLPTVEQSTTAQSSVEQFTVSSQTTVSPNQQSTSVAQTIIKAIVIPKQQYALIPSKTTASPMPPSTVATSVQSLQQRPLHPLITVVTPSKQLGNATPQKIIVVPRPMSSFTPHSIAALSPTQLSTVVSTVVAAQKNILPPASTAAGTPSLSSVPLKTIVVTPRQSLSAVTSQTTATSTDQQSVTLPHPKITIVVPRQVPAVLPRQQQSTVAPQTVLVTRQQQSPETPVAVSSAQSVSLSQQSSVTMDTPTAPVESGIILSHKWDNIWDNLESPRKTATVSKMTTVSTETCSNLKKSDSPVLMQTSGPPKGPPVFQEKSPAVVKLTKLSLPASMKEMAPVWKTSNLSTKTLSSLKDSPIPRPVPSATQEKSSASTQLSPAVTKEIIPFSKIPPLATKIHPCLKAIPITMPVQASALSKEPNAVQETPSLAVKSTQSISAASAKDIAPDSKISTSSSETCSSLKDSSITKCVQPSVPPKVSAAVLEKSPATINRTQPSAVSTAENATVSETPIISRETSSNLKEVPINRHVHASVLPNEAAIIQEKPSTAPLRLTSITLKDTTSNPHLQMTKTQFLAQLAVSPVVHVQQKALSSDAVDTRTAHAETSTGDLKQLKKDSLVARLRSHFRTRLQASKTESNPESFTEPEPTPVSAKTHRLAKDSATHKKTTSEPIAVSPKKPKLAKDVATPEKMTLNPTSISPRRSRLTKDGASPKKTVSEPTSVSPKRPRLSKDGVSPKKTTSEPTSVSPRRSRLTKDGASPKNATSEPSPLSPRWPRLANDGVGPKKTGESTDAKKPRLIQDFTSPKKSIRLANAKKLAKAAKAKKLAKIKKSNQSKSQNGAETRQLAENHARREALKKAKAKAVWTPPRMSANKSPLTRGRSLSLLPAKRDTRSQNQAQAPTTPQRRSQTTSPRIVTQPNQICSTPPNRSQTVRLKSASKGRPSSPRTVVYPPSVSLHPIPVKAPPIVSPLQPLSVIGRRLLKNQCGECGRILSSMAALESHVSLHTGRRPFSCTFCGKNFPDSKGLSRHGRVHRNGRIHICSQCGKGFVYRFGLTKHLQMVHGRVKPFVCQICSKGFFTKRDVEAHIRVHTGEKPFHCNLCEKRFKRRVELNVHLRWHNGEKRHWCPYCGKGFLDFNNLKRHKYIHTGEKPHSCPHCSKNFTQSGHLKKHVKNVHKDD